MEHPLPRNSEKVCTESINSFYIIKFLLLIYVLLERNSAQSTPMSTPPIPNQPHAIPMGPDGLIAKVEQHTESIGETPTGNKARKMLDMNEKPTSASLMVSHYI